MFNRFFSVATAIALGLSVSNANESVVLDKSVVTASGFAQSIKDAPATISIIDGDEIQNRPIRDLGDIVQDIPGVSTSISKTGSSSIQMRGMASKYTLILVDGKRINMDAAFDGNGFDSTSGFLPPVSMIEKVEIIRGPASLIYGSDAMGGVINIITKKSADKASATISLESRLQEHHDTWGNMYGLNGNVFAPLGNGVTLSLRGKYYDNDKNEFLKKDIPGYIDKNPSNPYTSHSPTGYVNYSLGGKINYDIDGANSVYLDSEYGFQRLGTLNTSGNQITAVREYHKYDNSIGHSGEYSWGKTNSYIQYALTEKIPHTVANVGDEKGEKNRANRVKYDNLIFSNQNMLNYDYGSYGSLILNFGPYLSFESLDNHQTNYSADQYTIAGYVEGEYLFNEYISSTLGGRVNHIETYGTFFNPRFYLNFYPTQDLTFKFGISSGLKAPDLGSRYDGYYDTETSKSGDTDKYGNSGLDVERTLSYEISTIYEWIWADISATAFYTQFSDAISTQTYEQNQQLPNGYGSCGAYGGSTCSIYENVDKAVSKGFELGIQSKALFENIIPRGIYADFSYGYTKTERKSGQDKGKALNDVPLHNLSTKLSYKAKNWDTYLRWSAKLKTPTDNSHSANSGLDDYFKDVHVVDLGANYKFSNGITIGAVINNLLDENFVDYVTYQGSRGLQYTNQYQRMIPGRNLWLNIRADF